MHTFGVLKWIVDIGSVSYVVKERMARVDFEFPGRCCPDLEFVQEANGMAIRLVIPVHTLPSKKLSLLPPTLLGELIAIPLAL